MPQPNRLRPIGVDEPVPELIQPPSPPPRLDPAQPSASMQAVTNMLMIALKALSQRTVIALASLVDLALSASVFALWVIVISTPTVLQLIGLGIYAMFVLIALFMRRGI